MPLPVSPSDVTRFVRIQSSIIGGSGSRGNALFIPGIASLQSSMRASIAGLKVSPRNAIIRQNLRRALQADVPAPAGLTEITTTRNSITLANSGSNDVFICKHNTSGGVIWATRVSGTASDQAGDVCTDSDGNIYITGAYASSPVTLYNEDGSEFGTLTNSGNSDAFIVKYNVNGVIQWATRLSGTSADFGISIGCDSSNNVYVTGYHTSTLSIYNEDATLFGTLATTSSSQDAFLIKFNKDGVAQWAARMGGTAPDFGQSICIDDNANVYVSGYYSLSFSVYNQDGTLFTTLANATPGMTVSDNFVVKYNSSGDVQWATRIGGTGTEYNSNVGNIGIDTSGNIYLVGSYMSTSTGLVTFYNSDGTTFGTLPAATSTDVYIAKYNSSGNAVWTTRITGGSGSVDVGRCITIDSDGNAYVGFEHRIATIYNSDGTTYTSISSVGFNDVSIVKYDTDGFAQRVTGFSQVWWLGNDDFIYGITSDSDDNLYVTCKLNENLTYILKFNSTGTLQWNQRIFGNTNPARIVADKNNNVYTIGTYTANPLRINTIPYTWTEQSTAPSQAYEDLSVTGDFQTQIATTRGTTTALRGPFISRDGGATWSQSVTGMTFGTGVYTNGVVVARGDSNVMYAANRGTGVNAPIWKSTDSGSNWTSISPGDGIWLTVGCSSDGSVILAGNSSNADANYSRRWAVSTNGGSNWTAGSTSNVDGAFCAVSSNGTHMYIGASNATTLYRSSDTGSTWSTTSLSGGILDIACSADGTVVFIGASRPMVSTNSGQTFAQINTVIGLNGSRVGMSDSGDVISAAVLNNNEVWIGLDKGISWYLQSGTKTQWASTAVSGDGTKIIAGPTSGRPRIGNA